MTVFVAIVALIILLIGQDARRLRRWLRHRLQCRPDAAPGSQADHPQTTGPCETAMPAMRVSVIVPARNEAGSISRCLDGLLCQTLRPREIIVVDDGSTDATPGILAEYAARHPTIVRIVLARPLPPGWVGKCNACQHGASIATGDWLLFVDADTAPQPGLLQAMVEDAEQRRLDALSVFPFNELGTLAERLILPIFFQFAWTVFPGGATREPEMPWRQAIASGQCFMFRAGVYQAMGGHACVKDKVLEDVEFAQALRRAGYRLGLAWGGELIRVRMYHSAGEVAQGLAKHAWAGRKAGGWRSYWGIARLLLTTLAPPLIAVAALATFLIEPGASEAISVAVASAAYGASWLFWRAALTRLYALPGRLAWAMPAGLLAYWVIVLRGTAAIMTRRGVQWKGRSYS
jgi:hypothetical protein